MGGLGIGSIMSIAMALISNRDKILELIHDIQQLWLKYKPMVETVVPEMIPGALQPPSDALPTEEGDYSMKWLQTSLNKLQDADLETDGDYGPATAKAIKEFQQEYGLTADGWAGPATTAKILELLAA